MTYVYCNCTLEGPEGDNCELHSDNEGVDILVHRQELVRVLRSLRYSGNVLVNLPNPQPEQSECDFLEDIRQWLDAYSTVLATASDTSTDMARELTELRGQRKAVRDFLGLSPSTGDM